jgi:arginase
MPVESKKVTLLGVPMDLGASKEGADGGPEAVRRAGIQGQLESLGLDIVDGGDIDVPERPARSGKPKYRKEILKVCERLCDAVYAAHKAGRVPVTLGGDHALAMGSVGGTAKFHRQQNERIGLIWVDAHADINTPKSSGSGNIHGMPVAHLLGMGDRKLAGIGGKGRKVDAVNVCLIGIRDVDPAERENLRSSGVRVFTMKEIDRHGMAHICEHAIEYATNGTDGIHVSFDIDAVDPAIAQGTGTPSRGGLTYRESHLLMELIADSGMLTALDMVEINPLADVHNKTAGLASELVQSALGKRIY